MLAAVPGARRIVMGHTIQHRQGINAACDGRALRIDVGASAGCLGGSVEVLEILEDGKVVRRLRPGRPPEPVPPADAY